MIESRNMRRNRADRDILIDSWLIFVAILVFLIIMVGGATRLTDSGLSIAHWAPIHGIIPPLSNADWQSEFALYKNIPEFKIQNHAMSLGEFQFIFWWEWVHRLLGRILGLAYLLPFLFFVITRRIRGMAILGYFAIGLLIGFQGFIGWWMVSSGLSGNRIDVAPYRLAAHLGMAFFLLAILIVLINSRASHLRLKRNFAFFVSLAIYFQIILGALVAGNRAGFIYNDWPTIGGKILPDAYLALDIFWENFIQNQQNTQFNHRVWAYFIAVLCLILLFKKPKNNLAKRWVLLTLVLAQISLGIFVLHIFGIHTPPHYLGVLIGVAHQAFAAIVFGYSVYLWCETSKSRSF